MPSPTRPADGRLAVGLLVAGFAVAYALVGLFKHWHFSSSFDLAIFDQAIWHLSRFEAPASTISGYSNILGDHFYPIIALFAPLYWIAPAPETLIVAQAILLASSIVPVFLFLRDRLPFGPALALAAAYGLFWGMQRTAHFDVHELAFAPVLVATAMVATDRRRWWLLWTASALLMLVKEDMIPLVAGFGAYLMLTGERRRGAALLVVSLAAFVTVVNVLIPWFSDTGLWTTGGVFDAVWRRPWAAPLMLFTPAEKIRLIVCWLAPFLFLSLGSRLGLLLVPVAVERLLSPLPSHWGLSFHYSAPLAPILVMSAGDTLARLGRRLIDDRTRRRVVAAFAGACVVLSAILPGHQPHWRLFQARHYRALASQAAGERALATIPSGASVVAQAALTPHLSQRHRIHVLQAGAPDADYVVASSAVSPWPADTFDAINTLLDERRQRGYVTAFDEDGWIVLRR